MSGVQTAREVISGLLDLADNSRANLQLERTLSIYEIAVKVLRLCGVDELAVSIRGMNLLVETTQEQLRQGETIDNLRSDLCQSKYDCDQIREQRNSADEQVLTLSRKIERLVDENESQERDIEELREEKLALERDVKNLQAEVESWQTLLPQPTKRKKGYPMPQPALAMDDKK